jgi:eukaryotic-like serine/threonine-protein kinase
LGLSAGAKLGPYEIVAPLGAGAMGEVFRARDTRLGRDVAIKVLPESFARDADRLRRFEQEARAVAALNHPNILGIYDVGAQGDVHYLVAELLEGESLRDKLNSGALGTRRAIEYGLQIAAGLGAAHARGVVHRDLKPENIFITRDGRVKILDFGLAKQNPTAAMAGASSSNQAETFAAATSSPTGAGMVMGTAGYMSPEQVRGLPVDHRSDLFALGAVLYEMLSGQRAFQRGSAVETMTAILNDDPPELTTPQRQVSPALDRIVRRCLEKEPEQRFQSAKDLGFALEALSGSSQASAVQTATIRRGAGWRVAAALAALVLVAIAAYMAGRGSAAGHQGRFERLTFRRGYIKGARFAPDGQNVIYSAQWEGRPSEVFTLPIGSRSGRALDLKNAMLASVSAAGDLAVLLNVHRVADTRLMQRGTLARAPASGGSAREILDDVWEADISRDGKQFAVVRKPGGPHQLEYPVGRVLYRTNGYISHPRISPDGKQVAFLAHPLFADDRGYVALADEQGHVRRLTPESASVDGLAWRADGRELWYASSESGRQSQDRFVFAVTLDGKARKIFEVPGDSTVWDVAPDGRLLVSHENLSGTQMVATSREGPERDVSVLGLAARGVLCDECKSVAFTESGAGTPADYLVYYRRLDGSPAVELGEGNVLGMSPDGKLVIASIPSQPTKIRILPTGAGEARMFDVAPVQVDSDFLSWMPGGREFVFLGHEGEAAPTAYRFTLDSGKFRRLIDDQAAHFWNRISPDGRWSLEGIGVEGAWGRNALVDLQTGKAQPSPIGAGAAEYIARWDKDGRHIYTARLGDDSATLFRVDAFTGERKIWKEIRLADPSGVQGLHGFYVTPSGDAYTYYMIRVLSDLYIYSTQ